MSLTELIAGVEDHEKSLTVFNTDTGTVESVRDQFRDRNLSVRAERTESGRPGSFVVLSSEREGDEDEVVTATNVEDDRLGPQFLAEGREQVGVRSSGVTALRVRLRDVVPRLSDCVSVHSASTEGCEPLSHVGRSGATVGTLRAQ